MENRGIIGTSTIAERLKAVQAEIATRTEDHKPILFVNGRQNRKANKYISKNLTLLHGLDNEIKQYCKGIDIVVLNYLVYKGLESVKKNDSTTVIDYADVESIYKDIL